MKRVTKYGSFNTFQYVSEVICLNRESIRLQQSVSNRYVSWSYSTVQLQYSTVQYSYGTVQLQYSTVTVQYSTVQLQLQYILGALRYKAEGRGLDSR